MPRPLVQPDRAVFPDGYRLEPLLRWFVDGPATRFRLVRAFFFGLPHSRTRTYFVARYYHRLMDHLSHGNFGFLTAVTPDAELSLFSFGTYRGREA